MVSFSQKCFASSCISFIIAGGLAEKNFFFFAVAFFIIAMMLSVIAFFEANS